MLTRLFCYGLPLLRWICTVGTIGGRKELTICFLQTRRLETKLLSFPLGGERRWWHGDLFRSHEQGRRTWQVFWAFYGLQSLILSCTLLLSRSMLRSLLLFSWGDRSHALDCFHCCCSKWTFEIDVDSEGLIRRKISLDWLLFEPSDVLKMQTCCCLSPTEEGIS